jgi:putative PIN family toxin of toxin-antitoxin system
LRIVLDTNVLVSGLLSEFAPPAEILGLLTKNVFEPCFDGRILREYAEVLSRPHLGIPRAAADLLLEDMQAVGLRVTPLPLPRRLADPDDELFLEVAIAAGAEFLVTGNLRHFPARLRQGVAVVSPREFLEAIRGR